MGCPFVYSDQEFTLSLQMQDVGFSELEVAGNVPEYQNAFQL
jgi:hypothetical protein